MTVNGTSYRVGAVVRITSQNTYLHPYDYAVIADLFVYKGETLLSVEYLNVEEFVALLNAFQVKSVMQRK